MRIEILHTTAEREHAEAIRRLVALQLGPEAESIAVELRINDDTQPDGCICQLDSVGHVTWNTTCPVHAEMAEHFAREAAARRLT